MKQTMTIALTALLATFQGACELQEVTVDETAAMLEASSAPGECSVSRACVNSSQTVSCFSDPGGTCSSGPADNGWVACDGVTYDCPFSPTTCTIGGATYSDGAVNPANSCQVCDVARSTTSWSNRNGHTIGSGFCKYSTCQGGPCAGEACFTSEHCSQQCIGGAPVCPLW